MDEFGDVGNSLLNEDIAETKATRLHRGEDYVASSSARKSALLEKQSSWKRAYSMTLLFAEVGEREYVGNGQKEHCIVC